MRVEAVSVRFLLVIAVLLIAGTVMAFAQPRNCGPLPNMLRWLAERYQEFPVFTGRGAQPGQRIVVTRAGTGTWTVIAITGDFACIMGAGRESEMNRGI